MQAEIRTHCGRDSAKEEHPGETIHCLMKAAMEEDKRRESKDRSKEVASLLFQFNFYFVIRSIFIVGFVVADVREAM